MSERNIKNTHNQAIEELTMLNVKLHCDVDLIESMSVEEAREELRAMNLDPAKPLPKRHNETPLTEPGRVMVIGGLGPIPRVSLTEIVSERRFGEIHIADKYHESAAEFGELGNVMGRVEIAGCKKYLTPPTPTGFLSKLVDEKIEEVQRRLQILRELDSTTKIDLERLYRQFDSCSYEEFEGSYHGPIARLSRSLPHMWLFISAIIGSLVSGIWNAPSPGLIYLALSAALTLILVVISAGFFAVAKNDNPRNRMALLNKAIVATVSVVVGLAFALGIARFTKVGSALLTSMIWGIQCALALIAGECAAWFGLKSLPVALEKRIEAMAKQREETKRQIAVEDGELRTLANSRDWLLTDRRSQVDPTLYTSAN